MLEKFIQVIWRLDDAALDGDALEGRGHGSIAMLRRRLEYIFVQPMQLPDSWTQPSELAKMVSAQVRRDRSGRSVFDWVCLLTEAVVDVLKLSPVRDHPWTLRMFELSNTRWSLRFDGFDPEDLRRSIEEKKNIKLVTLPAGELLLLDWARAEFLGPCGTFERRNAITSWLMGWSQCGQDAESRAEVLCEICAFAFGLPSRACQPDSTMREMLFWGLAPQGEDFKCASLLRVTILSRMLDLLYDVHVRKMARRLEMCKEGHMLVREWVAKHLCHGPKRTPGLEWRV
jgi:hypothetical protein